MHRAVWVALVLLLLAGANPNETSFRRFAQEMLSAASSDALRERCGMNGEKVCIEGSGGRRASDRHSGRFRRLAEPVNTAIKEFLGVGVGAVPAPAYGEPLRFRGTDCLFFSIVHTVSKRSANQRYYLGMLNTWFPIPSLAGIARAFYLVFERYRNVLVFNPVDGPASRPWESIRRAGIRNRFIELMPDWPVEIFSTVYLLLYAVFRLFPESSRRHLVLSWYNLRRHRYWCLILSHLSHSSTRQLARSTFVLNVAAPWVLQRVDKSNFYGLLLTGGATGTALVMLHHAKLEPYSVPAVILGSHGGGAAAYTLMTAACLLLNPQRSRPVSSLIPADVLSVKPFELLLGNVAFDFFAGSSDAASCAGGALGAWLFCKYAIPAGPLQ